MFSSIFHVISRKLHQATAPDYKIFLFEIEIKYLIKHLINNSYYGRVLKHHECNFKYYSTILFYKQLKHLIKFDGILHPSHITSLGLKFRLNIFITTYTVVADG